jgi:hypothetical protein
MIEFKRLKNVLSDPYPQNSISTKSKQFTVLHNQHIENHVPDIYPLSMKQ